MSNMELERIQTLKVQFFMTLILPPLSTTTRVLNGSLNLVLSALTTPNYCLLMCTLGRN